MELLTAINGVTTTQLSIIYTQGGDVFHAMKPSDHGYSGFGEAYFSTIEHKSIKGWKLISQWILQTLLNKIDK
mgnify:CR=1 FL=1